MLNLKSLAVIATTVTTLSACGGGSVSIGPIPTPTPAPKQIWQLLIDGQIEQIQEDDLLTRKVYVCQLNTIGPIDYFSQYKMPNGQSTTTEFKGLNTDSTLPNITLPVYIRAVASNRYQTPDTWLRINGGTKVQVPIEQGQNIDFNGDNHFEFTQINGVLAAQIKRGSCPAP